MRHNKRSSSDNRFQSMTPSRKICRFCTDNIDYINYKDLTVLKNLITDRGKIIPSRVSGVCNYHQRKVTVAVKRARNIALIPCTYKAK